MVAKPGPPAGARSSDQRGQHGASIMPIRSTEDDRRFPYDDARELFWNMQTIAPTIPNIIANGVAAFGTLPRFPSPKPAACPSPRPTPMQPTNSVHSPRRRLVRRIFLPATRRRRKKCTWAFDAFLVPWCLLRLGVSRHARSLKQPHRRSNCCSRHRGRLLRNGK